MTLRTPGEKKNLMLITVDQGHDSSQLREWRRSIKPTKCSYHADGDMHDYLIIIYFEQEITEQKN